MKRYLLLSITWLILTSCSDFLEEHSQDTIYVRTAESLEELLLGEGYMAVETTTSEISGTNFYYPYIHFMTDDTQESVTYAAGGGNHRKFITDNIFGYYTYQPRVGVNYTNTSWANESKTWERLYKHINVVNNVFDTEVNLPEAERNSEKCRQVLGEAHFLRRAYYFILVNLYGKPYTKETAATDPGVPLKLQGAILDKVFVREPVAKVYEQIVSDLKEAERYLSTTPKPDIIYQADSTAVHLLLSRVFLYMQDWEQAAKYAQKVIDARPELVELNGFTGGFLAKNSVETIFSMGSNVLAQGIYYNCGAFRISDDLYNSYGDNDLRKTIFMWKHGEFIGYTKVARRELTTSTPPAPTDAGYYTSYYSNNTTRSEVSGNFLLRTAEAYLNLAEAKAYLGEEISARKALEDLRIKRIDANKYEALNLSGKDLVDQIRLERRLELCLEGHRWFDLRRYMVCEKYPESKPITQTFTVYANNYVFSNGEKRSYTLEAYDDAYTFAIPQEVIDFNTGMEQNPRPERNYVLVD